LRGLELASREAGIPVVFPLHPRTKARINEFELVIPSRINLIDPMGFFDFLLLESNAALVFTDSGGVQEECCILRVPCITLRDDTERPETVQVGGNLLAGTTSLGITAHVAEMMGKTRDWSNPFGDGRAADRIVDILTRNSKISMEVQF
jgi:UDP-N-acetylglucosamine 2-epimerase (non-hydrolysing)